MQNTKYLENASHLLDGCQYRNEITKDEESLLKEHEIVAIFAYSDDCMELRGAIDDEVSCFDGRTIYLKNSGVIYEDDIGDNHEYMEKYKIQAIWHNEGNPYWTYKTDIPHETFCVCRGEELWCIGVILQIYN